MHPCIEAASFLYVRRAFDCSQIPTVGRQTPVGGPINKAHQASSDCPERVAGSQDDSLDDNDP